MGAWKVVDLILLVLAIVACVALYRYRDIRKVAKENPDLLKLDQDN